MELPTNNTALGPRKYRNNDKMIGYAEPAWQVAKEHGMLGIGVDFGGSNNNLVVPETGHQFVNLCSCSYLGLNSHPDIIQGGIDALREIGATSISMAEFRIRLSILKRLESELEDLFKGPVLPGLSCSVLTAGILPLVASGHLTDGLPRVMVFDKFAHFSMQYIKPICGDEALVLACPHNDLNYLEDICKKNSRVTYICDGVYSMGGVAEIQGLLELQDKYGLFLYIDDSHSLSILGSHGQGYVRSRIEMNELTLLVHSLGKAFGTSGGIAMLGSPKQFDFLYRHAGPVVWSQNMDVSAIGASLASIKIHRSSELGQLQKQLQDNIMLFDSQVDTEQKGNGLPVKVIPVGEQAKAVYLSTELYRRGFYTSAVFFPLVPQGKAAIRIMLRGDMKPIVVQDFVAALKQIIRGMPQALNGWSAKLAEGTVSA